MGLGHGGPAKLGGGGRASELAGQACQGVSGFDVWDLELGNLYSRRLGHPYEMRQ